MAGRDETTATREASSPMRQFYRSSNGDAWLLVRDEAEVVAVEHRPNSASGGRISRTALAPFLAENAESPQGRELLRLIGTLIHRAEAGPDTT